MRPDGVWSLRSQRAPWPWGPVGRAEARRPTATSDLFTTAGFQKAYDAVKGKAGENAQVLQVQVTAGGTDFKLRNGEQATGFIYTGGDLHDEQVDVVGPGSLNGQDFPISEVDPAAIDKIVSGVKQHGIKRRASTT